MFTIQTMLYVLLFIFGYVTCQTFYYFKSTRLSVILLRMTHLVSLVALARVMEDLYYARGITVKAMLESESPEAEITVYKNEFETKIDVFREKSIQNIIDSHPPAFSNLVDFDNWDSAMNYLSNNRAFIEALFLEDKEGS